MGVKRGDIILTQRELFEIATEWGAVRVGATGHPAARAASYTHEGYGGTMYMAWTENMMLAENRLLQFAFDNGGGRHNYHILSNARPEPGFVYVIQGRLYHH